MEGRGKRAKVGELAPREQGNRESELKETEVCRGKEQPAGGPGLTKEVCLVPRPGGCGRRKGLQQEGGHRITTEGTQLFPEA